MNSPLRHLARAFVVLSLFVLVALVDGPAAAQATPEDKLDLSTPRRAVAAFLGAIHAGDDARAAEVLDLRALPWADRTARGREAARELYVVLDRVAWIELSDLSDEPDGRAEDGADIELLAVARVGTHDARITLERSRAAGRPWRFSSATVVQIERLYEIHGPGPIESRVPAVLRGARVWSLAPWQWIGVVVSFALALLVSRVLAYVLHRIGARIAARSMPKWDDELVGSLESPVRYLLAVLGVRVLTDLLALGARPTHLLHRGLAIVTIALLAWTVIRVVTVAARWVEDRAMEARHDPRGGALGEAERRARGIATQVRVLRRVVNVSVGILAIALMLIQFELLRNIGVSLLASAGLAGVVLGFAAQRTFSSLIAGIQLSSTQPIRIGDVVIVEKEWGVIEEITLTYVVVRIWDERRLIVPMTRFLEHPFENWTKTSSTLHGTVFLYVDWTFPVAELRTELARILDGHPKWDGRTQTVVVTDAKERTIELRALVSAANATDLFALRADVREKLVTFVQQLDGGAHLPRLRHEEGPSRLPRDVETSPRSA